MMPDGKIKGAVVKVDGQRKRLMDDYKTLFEKSNSERRRVLAALLLEAMEKEGELE